MKKQYFEKKRFDPFKRHLYQNEKAEHMPVAARHLILLLLRCKRFAMVHLSVITDVE